MDLAITSKHCANCRYWSEMLARTDDTGNLTAVCLEKGSLNHLAFTRDINTCGFWQDGSLGAIDMPNGNPYEDEQ